MKQKIREYTENLENLVHEILGLSHTIKTIAGGLEGGTCVLEKGLDLDHKAYVKQGWNMFRSNVDKVKELSLGLLNYTKPMELNYKLCDPNIPAREVFELLKSRAEQHNIVLKLKLSPSLKSVYIDAERIQQCLLNLVSNAIDAVINEDAPIKGKRLY